MTSTIWFDVSYQLYTVTWSGGSFPAFYTDPSAPTQMQGLWVYLDQRWSSSDASGVNVSVGLWDPSTPAPSPYVYQVTTIGAVGYNSAFQTALTTDGHGFPVIFQDGQFELYFTPNDLQNAPYTLLYEKASITQLVVSTPDAPFTPPTQVPELTFDFVVNGQTYVADWGPAQVWVSVSVPYDNLYDTWFTSGADTVNFNNLGWTQQSAVAGGADLYDALGGGDTITLPNANPGDTTVPITDTNKTFDLTHTFVVGDHVGDTTTISGGNGSYNIALGGGSDVVDIEGDGNSRIIGGEGLGSVALRGNGHNSIDIGIGGISATLTGWLAAGSTTFNFTAPNETLDLFASSYSGSIDLTGLQMGDTIHLHGVFIGELGSSTPTIKLLLDPVTGKTADLTYAFSDQGSSSQAVFHPKYDGEGGTILTIDNLFTTGDEIVDFGHLTYDEQRAIANGADTTNGLGGNDFVILSGSQSFTTGSKAGDLYTVIGGSGDYSITLGAGPDLVAIDGNGKNKITGTSGDYTITLGGTGNNTVTINGKGTSTFTAGSGSETLSISGGGTLVVEGDLNGGSASIGANSRLELKGADSGSIAFDRSDPITGSGGTLQIDGTSMPTGVISGFAAGDEIDLSGVKVQSLQSGVLIEGTNQLSVVGNGTVFSLNLEGHYLDASITLDASGGVDIEEIPSPVSPVEVAGDAKAFAEATEKLVKLVVSVFSEDSRSFDEFKETFGPVFTALTTTAEANQIFQKAQQTLSDPNASDQQVLQTWSEATTEAVNLMMKVAVAGVLAAGAGVVLAGVAVAAVEGSVLAGFLLAAGVAIESLPVPVLLGAEVAGAAAYNSYWDTYLKQPVNQWIEKNIVPLISAPADIPVSNEQDGYISGATVFSDDNRNGVPDPGEPFATTDSTGSYATLHGSGPLVAVGGTDVSTGLTFAGRLSAPAGATVISPLTTLLTEISSGAAAQQKVLSALGLATTLDLTTFDAIAAAQSGSAEGAAAVVASAKVYDTVETIASALAGAGGLFSASLQAGFSALASTLDGAGIDLGDKAAVSALVTQVAQAENLTLGPGVADAVASVVAAGNAALDHLLQTETSGDQLLSDAAGVELVEQGAASTAIANAGGSLTKLEAIVNLFTGANFDHLVTQAQTETQSPGQNLGPIAFDGSATTDQNTILNGTISAIDLMGNTITYAVDGSTPAGLTFNSDGTFSFDPSSSYKYLGLGESTTLSFHFKASDGQGTDGRATETITITGLNDPPEIDGAHTTTTGTVTELPNTTGSNATDSIGGSIALADPDLTDRPTAMIDSKNETVTYQDASGHTYTLTPVQIAAFENALQITAETGNTNTGKIDWTYSITDKMLDFLGAGESITITAPVVIDDHDGSTVTQDVVVTIDGSNDNPIAVLDGNGVAKGKTVSADAAHGVLANDSDPDIHDHLSVSAVNGSLANVGHGIYGSYGLLTLNADGSYVYSADQGSLPAKIVAQDNFTYSVSDGHGGSATSALIVLLFNPSMVYQGGANTTLASNGLAPNVLDGSAGNDILIGSTNPDVLVGGNGDALTGGGGPDTFVFRPNFGTNTITDFNVNNSAIQFDKSIFASISDVLAHTSNSAQGAIISDAHGDTVTLTGVTLAQLQAHQSDFHLV